jgi:hypothetical protein
MQRYFFQALIVLIFVVGNTDAQASIPFEVRWTDSQGPASPTYTSITSRDQLVEFWTRLKTDQSRFLHAAVPGAADPPPDIDFSRYMLIVAAAGTKSTGGYSIALESVFESGDRVRVSILETSPKQSAETFQGDNRK